ncbi:MAG TPA: pyridoxal-phosphate dependent enzyme [Anaerolineales bacterium]|nr:pyridoxal-phosphate dependent enzyme [Anaerolineales bacterium]
MPAIRCTNCGSPYPAEGLPYRCPVCTGIFDFSEQPEFDPALLRETTTQPGIWRFHPLLGLPEDAGEVTLGEGNTPLVWGEIDKRGVAFKLETLNPTGSFKDRGSAVLASWLKVRGVEEAVEDSSGNAGASFAAYAARAGIRSRVFVPESASGPKRMQIGMYGAEIIAVPGPRSNAARTVQVAAENGAVYASHAYLPQLLPGYATLAYELYEQLSGAPGTVIVPAGQGNLLLAVGRGFELLQRAGLVATLPRLVGVQARTCAPLWAVYQYGISAYGWVTEGETLAEGVRVSRPMRGDAVIRIVEQSQGTFMVVDEEQIISGRDHLAHQGFYVEPTSALVWSAVQQLPPDTPEPVVAILTGSGLKTPSHLV